MRILGLDIGTRRTGVAISDPEELMAVPLLMIEHSDENATLESILGLIDEHGIGCIVVGMPHSLDGSLNKQAIGVEDFTSQLSQRTRVPIETWDERLSTVAAHKMMSNAGTKKKKRKEQVDALAATLILQGYLDRQQAKNTSHENNDSVMYR